MLRSTAIALETATGFAAETELLQIRIPTSCHPEELFLLLRKNPAQKGVALLDVFSFVLLMFQRFQSLAFLAFGLPELHFFDCSEANWAICELNTHCF